MGGTSPPPRKCGTSSPTSEGEKDRKRSPFPNQASCSQCHLVPGLTPWVLRQREGGGTGTPVCPPGTPKSTRSAQLLPSRSPLLRFWMALLLWTLLATCLPALCAGQDQVSCRLLPSDNPSVGGVAMRKNTPARGLESNPGPSWKEGIYGYCS